MNQKSRNKVQKLVGAYLFGVAALGFPSTVFAQADNTTVAQAEFQPIQNPYDYDYYKARTYTWTDKDGVEQTSDFTQRAETYEQIVALLKAVYTNPEIPGFVEDPVGYGTDWTTEDRNTFSKVQYKPCTFPPFNMDENEVIQTPIPGETSLIVELFENYRFEQNLTAEGFIRKIKAVQLLTKNMHIGDENSENPGWLYNYVGDLDYFFIISKGNNRVPKDHPEGIPPLYMMYEKHSPANTGPIYNAYDQMNSGEQFHVDHNCSSILEQNHIIAMSPENEDREYSMNFMFFLPDKRFAGDSRTKNGKDYYEWYTYYSLDHQPAFFFNKIKAEINEAPKVDTNDHIAQVKLEWKSTYKEITKSDLREEFYIYRVKNNVIDPNPLKPEEYTLGENMPVTEIQKVYEDGMLISSAETCVIYVKENQLQSARDIKYIVTGRRYFSDFEFVESNIVSTTIPGYEGTESLCILIDGEPKSTYDSKTERNNYRNTISVTDRENSSGRRLIASQVKARDTETGTPGSIFTLYRSVDNGADGLDEIPVAALEVTEKNETPWNVWQYKGVITYFDGIEDESRHTTASFKSIRHRDNPELDGDEPIQALDADAATGTIIRFDDIFSADTHESRHPDTYHYHVTFSSTSPKAGVRAYANGEATNNTAISNTIDVAVPIRELKVGFLPYTESEINLDTDYNNRLAVNPIGIQFETRSNPSLTSYTIHNITKDIRVMRAVRASTGKLTISRADTNGSLKPHSEVSGMRINPIVVLDANIEPGDEFSLVLTYANGNTYGNARRQMRAIPTPIHWVAELTENVDIMVMSDTKSYRSYIIWAPDDLTGPDGEDYKLYGWHTWGQPVGQTDYTLLNTDMKDGDNQHINVSTDFTAHAATKDNPVTMSHSSRMYLEIPSSAIISDTPDQERFIVSDGETSLTMTSSQGVITDVDEVLGGEEVTYRYFDITGIEYPADSLPSGVVVKVGSDGSAQKIMNRK
ncbi:MAG: hypothetical protein NC402_01010 [Prevotella sp.]|nr:hypothetical protein [Prevotella sp.]MCM1074386.1 hypothetical protein [Ruminococcus sp.]